MVDRNTYQGGQSVGMVRLLTRGMTMGRFVGCRHCGKEKNQKYARGMGECEKRKNEKEGMEEVRQ
jgi:hypothetical protein